MEKRENVLRDGLDKNEEEIQRWESYIKDNETAIENINTFSKRLTVDVMVPVGRKAFIPGRLIHTNEILMGHYQDYFSKCSAHTAIQICKMRIDNGKKHLDQLEVEKDLFQNKLEKPYLDGVLPNTEEREIIEEYDEEKERVWREEHRRKVKEAKQKEREEREEQLSKENAHDELIQTLEEDEEDMINELDEEISELKIQPQNGTQEILNRLLSGEMSLPEPKKRIAHSAESKRDDSVQLKPIETKENVQSINSINNHIQNSTTSELNHKTNSEMITDENDSDSSTTSDTPEEIQRIEKQAEYLPHGDRLGFYQYQLQIVDQKIVGMTFRNNKELQEKMQLFKIRDDLEEIIEILEDAASIDTDTQADDIAKDVKAQKPKSNTPKRKISFALEDQLLEFRKNETVAQMMPSDSQTTEEKPQRDIIRLDEPILIENQAQPKSDSEKLVDRRKTILEKVEDNLKTQSLEDVDLVTKIIDSSRNHVETLHIHFKHSIAMAAASSNYLKTDIPSNPNDLYQMVSVDGNHYPSANENEKESVSGKAYIDPRSEYLSPVSGGSTSTEPQSRSILKNKSAVDRETHVIENNEKTNALRKKTIKPKQEDEYLSAYNKVMSDVIENKPNVPDPLPEEKFVDMHTPKKRISRFKQMRTENNN